MTPRFNVLPLRCIVAAACLSIPHVAQANGFSILQQSPTSMGRSFAGDAAIASDASTAFFNPAAMLRLPGSEAMAHVTFFDPDIRYSSFGNSVASPGSLGVPVDAGGGASRDPGSPALGGGAFFAYQATDRLWFGFSLTAPFGLGLKYDDDYFGRYDSVRTELLTANFSPVLAYDVVPGVFAIGGGLDFQYGEARLTRAIPDPLAPGGASITTDGELDLQGDGWGVGFNIGAHLNLGNTRLGAHYRSGIDHELSGDLTASGLNGPLAALNGQAGADTMIDLPAILSIDAAHRFPQTGVTLVGGIRYFFWDAFDSLVIDAENPAFDQANPFDFRDSFVVSFGAEWEVNNNLTLRGGISYDRTPTNDTLRNTSLPDADRIWLGVGTTYAFSDRFEMDLAINAAIFQDGKVDRSDTQNAGTPLATSINTRGISSLNFTTAAIGLRWRF